MTREPFWGPSARGVVTCRWPDGLALIRTAADGFVTSCDEGLRAGDRVVVRTGDYRQAVKVAGKPLEDEYRSLEGPTCTE